ncbi:MAG: hydroxylase [Acidobacteriota bacterium]
MSWAQEAESAAEGKAEGPSVYYLEIVTPDVEGACELYGSFYDVTFGDPIPAFGGARTAPRKDGGLMGIRAPLRADEKPVIRPYFLVEDIDAAIVKATDSGALLAVPALPIEGHGRFAVLIQNGIEWGLWES